MDVPKNATSSDSLPAIYDNGSGTTQGAKNIRRLGRPITFDLKGSTGTADEQAAVRNKALRGILEEGGHQFGDDASEDELTNELQKRYPGRRIRIIVITVDGRDRQSVLNGMKYMDKFGAGSRSRMLDCAIANLGMLDQDKDRGKLCESIVKNRRHLGPQHEAALEGMSRDTNVAQALANAGYVTGSGNSYADMVRNVEKFPPVSKDQFLGNAISHLRTLRGPDHAEDRTKLVGALANARDKDQLSSRHLDSIADMAKSDNELKPLVDTHRTNLSPQRATNEASPKQETSKRQDMVRSREVLERSSGGLSL